jgi:1-deoxy-D-xylulose-5-phosphate synthase
MDTEHQYYPLLNAINSPADLRKLPQAELPQLCAELRAFLIKSLSENPGHFASSMGAVELTVALHYVLNTPYDRIVWDVGHQAYPHKILTGRRDKFNTNRKLGGLSGFPSPDESEYDTFTAGHASNSISAALGMAIATQVKNESPLRHVVAVIGDASISGGLAFEGINNAANTPNNLLIVLNDNNWSIDKNVGSLHSYLTHLNTSKNYNSIRYRLYKFLKRHNLINEDKKGFILRFSNAVKALLAGQQNLFEGLNIRYFGPFDGHDMNTLIRVINEIKDMQGPKILHLRTLKGKGYEPAERDPANWHAPGKFNPATGERQISNSPYTKYQDVFGTTLLELARKNDKVVAITAAMPSGTSIATMQDVLPHRVFDVGISEGHAVTFAGGLAKDGLQPVVGIYSSFLQRGYDHIIHDVAIQKLPVVFAIDRAGLVGDDGVTHHGAFDLAYMRTVPNMVVTAPRNEIMLRNLLHTALKNADAPYSIRYPRGAGHIQNWQQEMQLLPVGKGEKLADGNDIIVLSIGTIADNVTKAIELLHADGLSADHYDMIFLKPLDTGILNAVAAKGCPIVTVEDGTINGGLGSAVAEWLAENNINLPLVRLGLPDAFVTHGTVPQLQQICGIDPQSIYLKLKEAINKK